MPYSQAFIEQMRERLEQELEVIEQDLSGVSTLDQGDHVVGMHAPTFEDSDGDISETATRADDLADHAANVDVTFTLEQQEERVQKALLAIDEGSYGVCVGCESDIGEDRLRANPSADLCMSCAV